MKKFAFFIILLISSALNAQEVLDKVVAVVNNEVIMKSELDFQTAYVAAQRKLNPSSPDLKKQVLNAMVEEKLLYAQALLDSVNVNEDEVSRNIEYRINMFIQQYGSKEKVQEVYGMSIEKIRRELRESVRKELMSQAVRQKKFGMIDASRREVEEFYNTYRDSLGLIPEKYTIAHIFKNPLASDKVKKEARSFALSLLDSLKAGADFAALAKKYSEDPGTAQQGGDLGFSKRGSLVPEYESAAFALKEGELSDVVESSFGFHIIQLLEKRGETAHTRHILIKVKTDQDADLKAIEFLSELRDSVVRKLAKFDELARKYSDDKETRKLGGLLGTFDVGQLDKNLLDEVTKLKEGDISYPKRVELGGDQYGYHIVYLMKKVREHKADLDRDFEEIKQLAIYNKQQKLYVNWMKELKENIFWETRL